LQGHDRRIAELPAHRGFGQQELDAGNLGLRHAAAPGQPVTGQARRFTQVTQGIGEILAIFPCLRWI
jgi:hypothetical protein